jgi:hypothetical protein
MNDTAVAFVVVSTFAILVLPRRWAALPLLAAACYITVGQQINLGPFTFTVLRIVIGIGFVRAMLRREKLPGGVNRLDFLVLAWGIWAVASSTFHEDVGSTVVAHLGSVYNAWGIYFLFRVFCSSAKDIVRLARIAGLVLVPVALEMVYEHVAFQNLFSVLGAPDAPALREGRIRALGPFAHPILAGSVGGVTLPLMAGLWPRHRASAAVGILTCVTMVVASGSSGPLMTLLVAIVALSMWPFRRHMRRLQWAAAGVFLVLVAAMSRPPYYIIQKFELFGGSTGWYRSRLIESGFEHFDEWWFAGTDYTRHWMPHTNAINERHTDITNHYLGLCVTGGLPLLVLHLLILVAAFSFVRQGYLESAGARPARGFLSWVLGCALFAHAVTNISVSYFDQSSLFLYLTIAAIGSLHGVQPSDEVGRSTSIASGDAISDVPGRPSGWRRRRAYAWTLKNAARAITSPEPRFIDERRGRRSKGWSRGRLSNISPGARWAAYRLGRVRGRNWPLKSN